MILNINQNTKKTMKKYGFFLSVAGLPLLHFCLFYLFVNFNSIILAFQKYDYSSGYSFAGLENFTRFFSELFVKTNLSKAPLNSLYTWITSIFSLFLAVSFSYYLLKKQYLSSFFKVILFLPSIISGVIMVLIFTYFTERALPQVVLSLFDKQIIGMLSNEKTIFPTLIFFSIFVSFGPNILLLHSSMTNIAESVFDASKIDGAGAVVELFKIVIPMIWETLSTFIIVSIATLFTAQLNIFTFFSSGANYEIYTFGYFLYRETINATMGEYPYVASIGLVFTFIAVPLTFGARYLLNKLNRVEV